MTNPAADHPFAHISTITMSNLSFEIGLHVGKTAGVRERGLRAEFDGASSPSIQAPISEKRANIRLELCINGVRQVLSEFPYVEAVFPEDEMILRSINNSRATQDEGYDEEDVNGTTTAADSSIVWDDATKGAARGAMSTGDEHVMNSDNDGIIEGRTVRGDGIEWEQINTGSLNRTYDVIDLTKCV